eukprot:5090409-Amphidinium_carterae.1
MYKKSLYDDVTSRFGNGLYKAWICDRDLQTLTTSPNPHRTHQGGRFPKSHVKSTQVAWYKTAFKVNIQVNNKP